MSLLLVLFCIFILAFVLFVAALWRDVRYHEARNEKLEEEIAELKIEKEFAVAEKIAKREELEDAEKQKEKVRTGTDAQRFMAASDILHNNKK